MNAHISLFYYLALFAWPLIAVRIFNKYPLEKATFLCVLVPYLVLPVPPDIAPIDLPVIPPLDKNLIPIATLYFLLLRHKAKLRYFPIGFLPKMFVCCMLLGPVFTTWTNPDAQVFGPRTLQGMTYKDTIGLFLISCFDFYIPFVIGYSLLGTADGHKTMVKILAVGGLLYAVPMLYEIRMSPQLHADIYGYFPHEFGQQKRGGGFRPVVFLGHGLIVAFFCMLSAICVFILFRQQDPVLKGKGWIALAYILVTLVLCKTFSAIIYFLLFLSACIFLTERGQLRIVSSIALLLLLYPVVRTSGVLPLQELTDFIKGINQERADSLSFRLMNEESLLEHARARQWFGWGNWGRNHIYDENSGKMLSTTDGTWIVIMGSAGWTGYVGLFGLLCYPLLAVSRAAKKAGKAALDPSTRALAFVVALYALDQIPNASLSQMTLVFSGALLGWAELQGKSKTGSKRGGVPPKRKHSSEEEEPPELVGKT